MKKLLFFLSLFLIFGAEFAFGVNKIIKAPSGDLILDAKTGNYVKSSKTLQVSTIGTTSGDLTLSPTADISTAKSLKINTITEYTSTNGVQIKGRTDASYNASGYVGEIFQTTITGNNFSCAWSSVITHTLTPGVWRLSGNLFASPADTSVFGFCLTSSANSETGCVKGKNQMLVQNFGTYGQNFVSNSGFVISISSTQPWYFNVCVSGHATSGVDAAHFLAERIQ
jgi:hypothetical protein